MSSFEYLDKIKSPDDLKKLSEKELELVCQEIRYKLIEVVSENGGHLASNLGVVELTASLVDTFSFPKDSIVWDVGHQCYTYKMLTGRYDSFDTLRKKDGISGFPKRDESKYDDFNTGHSSTSISAAYGISVAKNLKGDKSYTIAVIGDGSFGNGMVFEALNNSGRNAKNFIIVLNDNKMSISKNVGALAQYLKRVRINPWYIRVKKRVEHILVKLPLLGNPIRNALRNSKSKIRQKVYKDTLFEQFGFAYFGPVDGHNIDELNKTFKAAKTIKGPVIVHVVTTKGKGYSYAEKKPESFHGIGKFDIESGEPISKKKDYSTFFGETMCDFAFNDKRICAITAAMTPGTGLSEFKKHYKDRFFDVGIAEEHAITFASGLASKGLVPVFAVYSTFLQRSYDQMIHDCAMQKLHVVIGIDRAGLVGDDGETHQGLFDVAMLNSMPNTTIFSPCYFDGMKKALNSAVYHTKNMVAVRYPRGVEMYRPDDFVKAGLDFDFYGNKNADKLIVTYGRLFSNACLAKEALHKMNIEVCILKLCKIKPISSEAFIKSLSFKEIYFYEEGILNGGIAATYFKEMLSRGYKGTADIVAIKDKFIPQMSVDEQFKYCQFDVDSIIRNVGGLDEKET